MHDRLFEGRNIQLLFHSIIESYEVLVVEVDLSLKREVILHLRQRVDIDDLGSRHVRVRDHLFVKDRCKHDKVFRIVTESFYQFMVMREEGFHFCIGKFCTLVCELYLYTLVYHCQSKGQKCFGTLHTDVKHFIRERAVRVLRRCTHRQTVKGELYTLFNVHAAVVRTDIFNDILERCILMVNGREQFALHLLGDLRIRVRVVEVELDQHRIDKESDDLFRLRSRSVGIGYRNDHAGMVSIAVDQRRVDGKQHLVECPVLLFLQKIQFGNQCGIHFFTDGSYRIFITASLHIFQTGHIESAREVSQLLFPVRQVFIERTRSESFSLPDTVIHIVDIQFRQCGIFSFCQSGDHLIELFEEYPHRPAV